MVEYKHNEPYYKIKFNDLDENKLKILSFEGKEEISELFEYRLELISDDPEINASQILNKKATFEMTRGDEDSILIHGIISQFEQRGRTPDYVSYYAILVPKLWRLSLTFRNEVYQSMNIEELVSSVLKDSGFSSNDFKFDLTESYSKLEYIVQYRETNLNFIKRRLEHFGIFFYFDHSGDNDLVVFTDSNKKIKKLKQSDDIFYNPNKDPLSENETIGEFTYSESIVTGSVKLKDYNYRFPEKQLMAESHINPDSPGTYYDFGDNFKNEKEAEALAKIRNQEIIAQSKIFKGISDSRLFRAGYIFKMGKHYRDEWNSEYIIIRINSYGTQRNLFGILPPTKEISATYENHFTAIPAEINYRPPRITIIPKITGIMSAKLESSAGDEYAFLDDQGRYKAKMIFDLSETSEAEGSLPIRLSQTYTGSGYGFHFPNHEGTELVWGCIDGNVDRPIGLGTVPNPSNSSPTTVNNKTQNIIRTAAGNEIIMNDKIDETKIDITSTDKNKISLDDKNDKIEIASRDTYMLTLDDKNENITVQSKNGHILIFDDKNEKITIQSKNGHRISINDGSDGENITLIDSGGGNKIIMDISNNKIVINTDDGDIDMHAPNGKIDIQATELNIETSGDTTVKAANINSKAEADYNIEATNITTEASVDLKLKGMNAEIKGDMELKAEGGTNAEVKGGIGVKVSAGATADLQGGAKTTISGGVVMIN